MFIIRKVGEMARQGAMSMEELIRNKVSKIRHWKLTTLGKRRPKSGFQFTVMTYNILSQTAVDGHLYLYMKCNPNYLSEDYRISRILPEILRSTSDVVCLQEVEQHLYDQRIRKVVDSNGFGSLFKKRSGGKSDGCAILWRRAKFSLIEHREVEFRNKACEVLNRDNVGLIAVLKPRHPHASHTQLHVATTHLLFNPRRGDVKLCQLRLLLAELERSALKNNGKDGREYHPTVLCGDFNFEPHSPLYRFVESGRLDIMGMIAGNMSGQREGRGKGGVLDGLKLSLDGLGIDESGRYKGGECRNSSEARKSSNSSTSQGETSSNSQFASYRMLKGMMHANLQAKVAENDSDSSSSADSDGTSHLFYHDFNFVPTYKYHQRESDFPITCMTGNDCNTVDHIFYNVKRKNSYSSYEEGNLKLLGVYTLPKVADLRDMEGLPNAHLGSDHFSLMSKFIIH